ncbi:MAG: 6-bladed beta-propeller [Rikenellaceae bacterium]|nr:6-bladed beta-propeller [Rikenellaceae bacterium]
MKNRFYLVLLLLLPVFSCQNAKIDCEIINYEEPSDQSLFFSDFVDSIALIQLDSCSDSYLTNEAILIPHDTSFYILNMRLQYQGFAPKAGVVIKFSSDGKFAGLIGDDGDGDGKYSCPTNFFINSDTLCVVTNRDKYIHYFKTNGEFITKTPVPYTAFKQVYKYSDNRYLVYLNLNNKIRDERLVVLDKEGKEIDAFLPKKTKVEGFYEQRSVFTKYGDEIMLREFYIDTIYQYNQEKGLSPRLMVEFGEKKTYRDEYLKSEGGYDMYCKYVDKPKVGIYNYFESKDCYIIQVFESSSLKNYRWVYGLKDKTGNQVKWFEFNNENTFLASSLQYLDGKKLYFMAQARKFAKADSNFRSKLKHPESLERIDPEGNSVVVVMNLKYF